MAGARLSAERTLERLLSRGLDYRLGAANRLRLHPYGASNAIKVRHDEFHDDAWAEWLATGRRDALSVPAPDHLYRFTMRREWHSIKPSSGRPLILRLPLPLREALRGDAQVRVIRPSGALLERRDSSGRIELRVLADAEPPIIVEYDLEFSAGAVAPHGGGNALMGEPIPETEQRWLKVQEGTLQPGVGVEALAVDFAARANTAAEFADLAWEWLMSRFHCDDIIHADLASAHPLDDLLRRQRADCILISSLLVSLCRAAGVPARLVSGYLIPPASIAPHSWAEIRVGPQRWAPYDFCTWNYCAGDTADPEWGSYYRGTVDARFVAEVAPLDFTGWGSAPPPARWYRQQRLQGDEMVHTLSSLDTGALWRKDYLSVKLLSPT